MMPQEQMFFTDHSVYISNTRLVLRKGGTYTIANLAQVTLGQVSGSRSWIGSLIFGLIFLALGVSLNQNSALTPYVQPNGVPYLMIIGGSLLLIGFVRLLFQVVFPLYVVVLKGTFGTARPIKSRNRRYIIKVVEALNEAMSKRDTISPTVVSTTHIGQIVHDMSHRSSSDIIIGQGSSQINIGTSGNVTNMGQASDVRWPISSPNAFNNSSLNTLSDEARVDPLPGALNSSGLSGRADQPVRVGTRAQKIIISYSPGDRQWRDLLRTHLAPLEQQRIVEIWDDTRIPVGMDTQQAMTNALKVADFALLLVSAKFLESDVIMRQILERLSQGQFTILPLILSHCLYNESPFGQYRPFNPNNPLSGLSPPEQGAMLVHVAEVIRNAAL